MPQRTKPDKYGFSRLKLPRKKRHHGLCTGDFVQALVLKAKHAGVYVGWVWLCAPLEACVWAR